MNATEPRRIVLVAMPFGPAIFPALGLSLLKPRLRQAGFEVRVLYGTLQFAAMLGYDAYDAIAMASASELVGDRVFAAALRGDPEDEAPAQAALRGPDRELAAAVALARSLAVPFVESTADAIVAALPSVVGFTSTFAQHAASLAVARAVKARAPDVAIVFGGANCEGSMGDELARRYPFVDAVVSGEGDDVVVDLVERLTFEARERPPRVVAAEKAVDVNALPLPDFGDFFDELARVDPECALPRSIMVESSRGCWWGAKHHYTF
ncbi:MAG TPA: cobalamin-dependent protein, partial [Candidatus Elarobacter sp.]|nr:cobalamin-dependent protein [Candidatus Elarobacter sp.]